MRGDARHISHIDTSPREIGGPSRPAARPRAASAEQAARAPSPSHSNRSSAAAPRGTSPQRLRSTPLRARVVTCGGLGDSMLLLIPLVLGRLPAAAASKPNFVILFVDGARTIE
jgi:hypothetical protein